MQKHCLCIITSVSAPSSHTPCQCLNWHVRGMFAHLVRIHHGYRTSACEQQRAHNCSGQETWLVHIANVQAFFFQTPSLHAATYLDQWPALQSPRRTRQTQLRALQRQHRCKAPRKVSWSSPTLCRLALLRTLVSASAWSSTCLSSGVPALSSQTRFQGSPCLPHSTFFWLCRSGRSCTA